MPSWWWILAGVAYAMIGIFVLGCLHRRKWSATTKAAVAGFWPVSLAYLLGADSPLGED